MRRHGVLPQRELDMAERDARILVSADSAQALIPEILAAKPAVPGAAPTGWGQIKAQH
jgi:hypothetical protein